MAAFECTRFNAFALEDLEPSGPDSAAASEPEVLSGDTAPHSLFHITQNPSFCELAEKSGLEVAPASD